MNKSNLSCQICTKYEDCVIVQNIKEIKRKIKQEKERIEKLRFIQLPITSDFNSSPVNTHMFHSLDKLIKELRECKNKQQRCFNKRKYLHKHKLDYFLFKDEKYDHKFDDDPQFLYFYCNKWREYLLNYPQNIEEELDYETM